MRVRWPDVLARVQSHGKRVAWMQLSNASVESFADGVLTLAFAQAGIAKGFVTGGYDKDLSQVLSDLFGVTPTISTSVGTGGSADSGHGTAYSARPAERPAAPSPADGEPGSPGDAVGPGTTARAAEPGRGGGTGRPQEQASARSTSARPDSSRPVSAGTAASARTGSASQASARAASARPASARSVSASPASAGPAPARSVSARGDDNEPAPGDRPAPDVLTGTDLIERELGGRIIQELDGP
jgi:DNA polymerase-3 subunit gamma/tau